MAEIFNEQRKLGIRIVVDGATMHNGLPVIGLREASDGVLFIDNQRVLGVDVLDADQAIYNEQPVRGAVMIDDGRTIYNGERVTPSKGGASYEPEAVALFARMTVQPDGVRKAIINDFWKTPGIKAIMAKLDALYLMAAHDAQAARLNWQANSYNLTAVAAPTFVADRGYQSDGLLSYLDTGFNPFTAVAPKYVQDSASIGVASRTAAASNFPDMGNDGARITCRAGSDTTNIRLNSSATVTPANAQGTGIFVVSRTSSATVRLYRNGGNLGGSISNTSTTPQSQSIRLCGQAGTVLYSSRQQSAALIGSGLTDQEIADLSAATIQYLTAVGAM